MKKIFRNRAFKALICVIVALSLGAVIAAYTHNNSAFFCNKHSASSSSTLFFIPQL